MMTREQRQYIIHENLFGKSFQTIAAEIGLTPQAIYNDRNRHPEKWEYEKEFLDFIKKCRMGALLDNHIKECRELLIEMQSRHAAYKATVEADRSRHSENPKNLALLLKNEAELDIAFARLEKYLCLRLSEVLTKRYDLPDVVPNLYGAETQTPALPPPKEDVLVIPGASQGAAVVETENKRNP